MFTLVVFVVLPLFFMLLGGAMAGVMRFRYGSCGKAYATLALSYIISMFIGYRTLFAGLDVVGSIGVNTALWIVFTAIGFQIGVWLALPPLRRN